MKNFKTIYDAQTKSRLKKIIQPPTRRKFPTSLEQKFSEGYIQEYTDICLLSTSNENVFSDTNQKHICWKVCKGD